MRGGWGLKIIIAIALPLLCYWGSARYLVTPIEKESYALLNELKSIRIQKRELTNRLSKQGEEVKRYLKLQNEVSSIKLAIPPKNQITKLIRQLPALAQQSQVVQESVVYKPFKDVMQKFQLIEFDMPINGSYANIRRFIYELEKMTTTLSINALTLKQSIKSKNLSLQINVSAYYQKP